MVKRYRTKPCEIEAIQWDGTNKEEIEEFLGQKLDSYIGDRVSWLWATDTSNDMIADKGDYIIKGLRGEFYYCKPDMFEKEHEVIEC